ncbi:MAG: hypothetical protein U1F52_09085 [Burkholderiales bacterium]
MADLSLLRVELALASYAEVDAAIDRALAHSLRRIDLFENVLDRRWNQSDRIDRLRAFCLAGRRNEFRIVLHDAESVLRHCPRIASLQRTFSHVLSIRETRPEARSAHDALLIVDGMHHVLRFHADNARGRFAENAPEDTRPLCERFEEIWAAADPAVPATTIGL